MTTNMSAWLLKQLDASGLDLFDLARLADVGRVHVSDFIAGAREPDFDEMLFMMRAIYEKRMPHHVVAIGDRTLNIADAAATVGCSKSIIYDHIASGELKVEQDGREKRVTVESLNKWAMRRKQPKAERTNIVQFPGLK